MFINFYGQLCGEFDVSSAGLLVDNIVDTHGLRGYNGGDSLRRSVILTSLVGLVFCFSSLLRGFSPGP